MRAGLPWMGSWIHQPIAVKCCNGHNERTKLDQENGLDGILENGTCEEDSTIFPGNHSARQ